MLSMSLDFLPLKRSHLLVKSHNRFDFALVANGSKFFLFLVAKVPLYVTIISTGVICTFYTSLVSKLHVFCLL